MPRKIKPTLIRLPGFVPSGTDVHPSLPITFERESSEIFANNHEDVWLDEHDDFLELECGGLECMELECMELECLELESLGLEDDHLLFDQAMHFDHDIPERVGLRALLARAVC